MILIALAGRAQHGKSSLAKKLCEYLRWRDPDRGLHVMPFAGPLKDMLLALRVPMDSLYGTGAQKAAPIPSFGGVSGRYLMQSLGTGWGRNLIGDDFWCLVLQRNLDALSHTDSIVIVDDVRHIPEIEMLRRNGAYIFEVYRPAVAKPWWRNLFAHSSERLNFQKHGLKRIIAEEGDTAKTLQKLLAEIPELR